MLGRPPRLGEHTIEVRAEPRRAPSVPPVAADPPPSGRPLDGVKVLDFMWAFAGPYATRILADHGATVVKIETSHKVDVLRVVAPWNDPSQSVESALQYHSLNAGKLGLALDLSKPGGPRCGARPRALGRRGDRVVLPQGDARRGTSATTRCAR